MMNKTVLINRQLGRKRMGKMGKMGKSVQDYNEQEKEVFEYLKQTRTTTQDNCALFDDQQEEGEDTVGNEANEQDSNSESDSGPDPIHAVVKRAKKKKKRKMKKTTAPPTKRVALSASNARVDTALQKEIQAAFKEFVKKIAKLPAPFFTPNYLSYLCSMGVTPGLLPRAVGQIVGTEILKNGPRSALGGKLKAIKEWQEQNKPLNIGRVRFATSDNEVTHRRPGRALNAHTIPGEYLNAARTQCEKSVKKTVKQLQRELNEALYHTKDMASSDSESESECESDDTDTENEEEKEENAGENEVP